MLSIGVQFYEYARHMCIFEKMEYRCKARQADKILLYTEHPTHIALNGGKKNLGPKSHAWAPLRPMEI